MIFEPPRFVKPRKPYSKAIPIIAVDKDMQAWSDFDSVPMPRPLSDVLTDCKTSGHSGRHPGSILVCTNPIRVLLHIHEQFKAHSEWNFKVSIHDKDTYVNGAVQTAKDDANVSFFGFRDTEYRNTWYHYVIAPSRYTRTPLRELIPGDKPEIVKLYDWACSLYAFASKNKIKLSGSAGGLASQLLRDERFYPVKRRKVPMATNERAREALPGNHYEMRSVPKRVYPAAVYFDQENAHHYAARTVKLPNADWLYARGYFHEKREWCTPETQEYKHTVFNEYGLLYARVWVPRHLDGYLPPWAGRAGLHDAYIFTNEIPLLEQLGVEIRYLYASWTSPTTDNGLAKYGRWAEKEIQKRKADKKWLKSVFLAAYGVLASKPRRYEFGYYRAKGEYGPLEMGPHEIQVVRTKTRKENQLPIANVIHRGMIEAETRKLSIELARQFEREGFEVLSIYADGVIVRDDAVQENQFPLVPAPWRAKHRLKHIAFLDATAFESELLSKMPGRRNVA
jgi:hypothetical protein